MDYLIFHRNVTIEQECSSRDISRSSMAEASENSGNRRLLLLKLTDGQYSHVPSFPDDISLGTRDSLNDHRRSLAARVNAPSPRNPEKATALERPKGVLNAAYGSLKQFGDLKLLQKTSQPSFGDRDSKFLRRMGKDTEDDSSLLTLDDCIKPYFCFLLL
ncbi:hypothetical protein SASPL_109651 [Salvia splendens]|uniref:Uncharacterized protein n=1 Tax=Salvia splendens TaxID=180675 RepID=A0A8X8YJ28_SALSN|nr:hypothetical protein SASPL_109651 [Salvia splendens]